ncbi:MAG TPA: hypothetical protein VNT20_15275 [Flavisolibacter sp.]|jgi:hypothetical protein|nr:hypothetical protein [Flavisolibacter sp.]
MKFFTETFYDTQAGVLEFHFERVGYPTTTGYKVAVIVGPDETYNFVMKESDEKWKIVDMAKLPAWINNFEEELSDSICAHHKRTAAL